MSTPEDLEYKLDLDFTTEAESHDPTVSYGLPTAERIKMNAERKKDEQVQNEMNEMLRAVYIREEALKEEQAEKARQINLEIKRKKELEVMNLNTFSELSGAGYKISADILTELADPEYYGLSHYGREAGRTCKGPLCKRFNTDRQRYRRRTVAIRKAIKENKVYIERVNRSKYPGREEETKLILALMIFTGRPVSNALLSAAERDGIVVPANVPVSTADRTDIVPEYMIDEIRKIELQRAEDAAATRRPTHYRDEVIDLGTTQKRNELVNENPSELLKVLAWFDQHDPVLTGKYPGADPADELDDPDFLD